MKHKDCASKLFNFQIIDLYFFLVKDLDDKQIDVATLENI